MDRIFDVLGFSGSTGAWIVVVVVVAVALLTIWHSLLTIGPTEVGLVRP